MPMPTMPMKKSGTRVMYCNLRGTVLLLLVIACCQSAEGRLRKPEPMLQSLLVSRTSTFAVHEQVVRRVKSPKGSKDNELTGSVSGRQTLMVSDLKMMLRGIEPLGKDSRKIWEATTKEFIQADIWNSQKNIKQLDLNVNLARQDPPYQSRRQLQQTLNRLLQDSELSVFFQVDMAIESKDGASYDAFNLVSNAFNTNEKRAAYMSELRATGDPAFGDSVNMKSNIVSAASPAADGRKIGIIVGIVILALIVIGVVAFVLHGNRTNTAATQIAPDVENDKDDEQDSESTQESPRASPQQPRVTRPIPADEPIRNNIPATILVDDSSQYFDGDVSVAWSFDTETQPTRITQISNLT